MSTSEPLTKLPQPSFSLLQSKHGKILLELHPPYASDYFVGHFPNVPVLPGVTLLTWTYQFAAEVGLNCAPNRLKNLKFTHVIKPDTPLTLELIPDGAKNRVGFTWRTGTQNCASGILLWNTGDE